MRKKTPFADLDTLRVQSDADAQEFQRYVQNVPKPTPEKRSKRERFVMVPIEAAGQVAQAMHEPRTFIWLLILYLAWKTGSKTVALSNAELRKRGIALSTKRRALAAYEREGFLKVERYRGRSAVVTLLR